MDERILTLFFDYLPFSVTRYLEIASLTTQARLTRFAVAIFSRATFSSSETLIESLLVEPSEAWSLEDGRGFICTTSHHFGEGDKLKPCLTLKIPFAVFFVPRRIPARDSPVKKKIPRRVIRRGIFWVFLMKRKKGERVSPSAFLFSCGYASAVSRVSSASPLPFALRNSNSFTWSTSSAPGVPSAFL
jgi:hypothetical protein